MGEIIACAIIAVVAIFGSTVFVWCLFQLNRRITDLESSRDDLVTHVLGKDHTHPPFETCDDCQGPSGLDIGQDESGQEEQHEFVPSFVRDACFVDAHTVWDAGKRLDYCPSCGYTVREQNDPRCQCVIDVSGT